MGRRTPLDPALVGFPGASVLWNDVWTSDDLGASWQPALPPGDFGQFPARAYFQALTKGNSNYVLGGQNFKVIPNPNPAPGAPPFISSSDFFNDVCRSHDGVSWTPLTTDAPWSSRAGLSSVVFKGELYVLGGSANDDSSIIGGPPQRVYFNDVWRSRDGANWELVTPSADWSPRPGHQAVVLLDRIIVLGGFGLSFNPSDMWASRDGATWTQVSDAPWNAMTTDDIKYDFDALAVQGGKGGLRLSIFTFGGDRETFNFGDPLNHLRVDNDVWRWSLSKSPKAPQPDEK